MGEILNEVAIRQGEAILSELLQQKLGSPPPETPSLPRVAMRTARDWEELLASTLGRPGNLLKRTLTLGTRASTFWGSSLVGFLLPDREARFYKKGEPGNYLALQSAPMVSIEIMVEWLRRILEIAEAHPEISDKEKQELHWLTRLFSDVEEGLHSGARWKRGKGSKPIAIALAPLAYHRLEHWFSSWNSKKKTG